MKHSLNLSLRRGTTLATFVALLGLAFSAGPAMAGDKDKDDDTEIKHKSKTGKMELEVERESDETDIDLEIETSQYELERDVEIEDDGTIEVEYEFEGTLAAPVSQLRANFRNVNFAFDSAALSGKSRRYLSKNAKILKEYPSLKVRIEGHTDEAGSDDYNKKLGAERAAAARDFLVKKGVSPSQLETVSYGEQQPAVQVGEVRNKENRRVVFSIRSKG